MILCHLINLTRKQHHHGRLIALIGFRGTIRQTCTEGHFCKTRPMVFYTRSRNQAKISLAPWIKIKRHDSELGSFYQKGHFNIYYLHLFKVCVCVCMHMHPCVQAHMCTCYPGVTSSSSHVKSRSSNQFAMLVAYVPDELFHWPDIVNTFGHWEA